ncbi:MULTISPECIES: DUF45 domain-containing protein [unclassified Sphingobacterium]|uniref:DUF45 domain-containing protein n=1 Tax=unclassified Sphingobacterium TaxID=2609468 RepID=UPI0025FD1234|nr:MULTISPECIES: DUF45 domain-containing protein [unclassified Sphingobacterium]
MQIEIANTFYEIIPCNKDYIQVLGSLSPYRVYAPAHWDMASVKEYLKLNPPTIEDDLQSYAYLDNPYILFGKPYLVKIYSNSTSTKVNLTATSIAVYQNKSTNTLKLLSKWSKELLYNEVIKQMSYWEEQLDIYNISSVAVKKLPKSEFTIVDSGIYFSNRLIDLEKEHINRIVLKAFCKFAQKSRMETEAIFDLFIPNWKELCKDSIIQ